MISILCIIGGLWVGVAALFIVALGCAARKQAPTEDHEAEFLKEAA
jgi:hypothetical protein